VGRLTNEQLAEIRERAEAATPGPWEKEFGYGIKITAGKTVVVDEDEGVVHYHDADLITHSREDIPKLLAEIERLKVYENILNKPIDLVVKDKDGVAAKIYGASLGVLEANDDGSDV
jgi:hypothetical protein